LLLLQGFVFLGVEGRAHHPADRVGAAAKGLGQHEGGLPESKAGHEFLFLAVAEPGGSHDKNAL
jgi:hypothetical protein